MIVYQLTPEKTIADIENTGIGCERGNKHRWQTGSLHETAPARVIQQKILLQKELRMKIQPVQKKYI